jgi:hypothetical protein
MIAINYLMTWFVIDFFSTLPVDKIATLFMPEGGDSLRAFKIIRSIRLVRLVKLVRLLKLSKVSGSVGEYITLSPALVNILSLLIKVVFIAHLLACFWYMVGTLEEPLAQTSWIRAVNMERESVSAKYLVSIYWAFTTMSTVGYGDILPVTTSERMFAIFGMILGATVFGFVVGNVASLVNDVDVSVSRYNDRMDELKNYMRERNFPKSVKEKFEKYYHYYLSRTSVFDEEKIMEDLPQHLRVLVLLHVNRETLKIIKFFHNKDPIFKCAVIQCLLPLTRAPGEYIFKQDVVVNEMSFLVRGDVSCYQHFKGEEKDLWIRDVEIGTAVGQDFMLSEQNSLYYAQAETYCDLFVFRKRDIVKCAEADPGMEERLSEALINECEHFQDKYEQAATSLLALPALSGKTDALQIEREEKKRFVHIATNHEQNSWFCTLI